MRSWMLSTLLLLSACAVWPQDAPPPAATVDFDAQTDELRAPEHSRTLVNGGLPGEPARNYLNMGVALRTAADTNPSEMAGAVGTDMATALTGFATLSRDWRFDRVYLSYEGGENLYVRNTQWDSDYHHAAVVYEAHRRFWLVNIREEMDYSPNSPSGSGRAGSRDAISGSATGLSPNDVPNQSILTPMARQLNNTTAGQVDILVNPKNTFTFSGSYGILRIIDDELLNGAQMHGNAGYVHHLTGRNRIGGMFDYGTYRYNALNTTVYTSTAMAYFAREVGRRLLVQISAGPQFTHSTIANTSDQGIAVDALANWRVGGNAISAGYFRGMTGGSGVLASASTNSLSAGVARSLSRRWSLSTMFSYAQNDATATANILQPDLRRQSFTSVIGRSTVTRELSGGNRMFFGYSIYRGGRGVCASAGCTNDNLRHVIEFGLEWRFHPVRVL